MKFWHRKQEKNITLLLTKWSTLQNTLKEIFFANYSRFLLVLIVLYLKGKKYLLMYRKDQVKLFWLFSINANFEIWFDRTLLAYKLGIFIWNVISYFKVRKYFNFYWHLKLFPQCTHEWNCRTPPNRATNLLFNMENSWFKFQSLWRFQLSFPTSSCMHIA